MDNKNSDSFIPDFSGVCKSGCIVYKGTPHIINKFKNSMICATVISIALCVVFMLICAVISVLIGEGNQSIQDFCQLMFIFSIVAIILTLCAFMPMILSFNKNMAKIYLHVSHSGIEGITKNQHDKMVYYSLSYDDLYSVIYTVDEVIIETTSGDLLIYDVFYNPHEIYKTIFQMSRELERLAV